MPYHTEQIAKGVLGQLSKIEEELMKARDAELQDNPVMLLLELSDIIGAIDCYLQKHHPTVKLEHLVKMVKVTQSAFQDGTRK